jgi:hypothetical protein
MSNRRSSSERHCTRRIQSFVSGGVEPEHEGSSIRAGTPTLRAKRAIEAASLLARGHSAGHSGHSRTNNTSLIHLTDYHIGFFACCIEGEWTSSRNRKTLTASVRFMRSPNSLSHQRKTGARGLRSIMEAILLATMFDLPSLEDVEEVVISNPAALVAL